LELADIKVDLVEGSADTEKLFDNFKEQSVIIEQKITQLKTPTVPDYPTSQQFREGLSLFDSAF
jgi:hypothetical protein